MIIDPTGEYKDSFPEQKVKKLNLGIDTTISPGKLSMQQWSMLFETNSNTRVQYWQRQSTLCVISRKKDKVLV